MRRELKNTVKRLVLLDDWETVRGEMVTRETRRCNVNEQVSQSPSSVASSSDEGILTAEIFPPLKEVKKEAIRKAERELIRAVLLETEWNHKKAAKILQISYKALLYKIKEHGLAPEL